MKILFAPLAYVLMITFTAMFAVVSVILWLGWQLLIFLLAWVVLGADAIIDRIRV